MAYSTKQEQKENKRISKVRGWLIASYATIALIISSMMFVGGCSQQIDHGVYPAAPEFTIYEPVDVNYTNPLIEVIVEDNYGNQKK